MKTIHKKIDKEGLTIPVELLREADLGEDISIVVKPTLILIRPKSLTDEYPEDENQSSAHELLYSIGDRAVEGKLTDGAIRHDYYLYSRGEAK